MNPLRFGLAGAGFWSHYQLAAWRELPDAVCVAVCDRDKNRAAKLAASHSVSGVYGDAAEMIQQEDLDFLDIVTDVSGHVELVTLAAEHNLPVICQKPMAKTLAECNALVEFCRNARAPFAIHENWRWQTPLRRVKELLSDGVIGTPFRCRIDMVSGFNLFANQPSLRNDERFIVADIGCHLFDLARCYFGDVETVYCRANRVHSDIQGEDVATAILGMKNGGVTVTVNMAYAETPLEHECFPQTLVFIEGDRGSIEVAPDCWVRVTTRTGTHSYRAKPQSYSWANPDYAVVHSSIVACQNDLLQALITNRQAETDAADNLQTMKIVFAAYDSADSGRVVCL